VKRLIEGKLLYCAWSAYVFGAEMSKEGKITK